MIGIAAGGGWKDEHLLKSYLKEGETTQHHRNYSRPSLLTCLLGYANA